MGNKSNKTKGQGKAPKKAKLPKYTMRVLVLGISGSGKSTFAKQMKIITNGGFDEEDVRGHREIILQNVLVGMQELIKQAEKLEYVIDGENRKHSRFITQMAVVEMEWTSKLAEKIKTLWEDPAIQKTWGAAPCYQLQMNHMDYLMANLDRFSKEDYVPTNEDILRARQRTTGEHCTSFVIDKVGWDLIDVGGQRPERAKWEKIITSKESVNAIIYFASLDEFNMASSEEMGKTKMEVSVQVFEDLLQSPAITGKHALAVILFLNKVDLFTTKLQREEDRNTFKEMYPDWQGTVEGGIECIRGKFLQNHNNEGLRVTHHAICALNTGLMSSVFQDVRQHVFDCRLYGSGVSF